MYLIPEEEMEGGQEGRMGRSQPLATRGVCVIGHKEQGFLKVEDAGGFSPCFLLFLFS
jgi:hypothetical protein